MINYKESFYNLYYHLNNKTFIYNIVSGVGANVNNSVLNALKTGKFSDEELSELRKIGFVVPSEVNEYLRLKELAMGEIWNTNPKDLLFVITPSMGCNLNCKYCFEPYEVRKQHSPVMSDETQANVIKFIKNRILIESKKLLRHVSLSFFGGEPTLHLKIVMQISSTIKKICEDNNIIFDARLITNGTLLKKDVGARLYKTGISMAQITLDGNAEDYVERKGVSKDVYDTLIKNICDNSDVLKIKIRVNVDNNNKDHIPYLMEYLFDELNLKDKISLYFAQVKKWNESNDICYISAEDYGKYLETYLAFAEEKGWISSIIKKPPKMKITPCGMLRSGSVGIGYDGSLYGCTHGFSNPDSYKTGNINTGLFANIFDYNFKMLQENEKCSECKYFPICWGGCRNNIRLYNDRPDCNLVKKETDLCVSYSLKSHMTDE